MNDEFMKQFFKAQDESDGDPKLFKKLVMKYTGLTPSGFKDEMAGPIGKTLLLKGKPVRDYYIKSDSNLTESDILFLKKYAGMLSEDMGNLNESMLDSENDPINKEYRERVQTPLFQLSDTLNSNFVRDRRFHLRYRTDRSMEMSVNATIEVLEEMIKKLREVKNSRS